MLARPLLSPFDESANGGGSGVENVDLVTVDDAPEAVGFGVVGRAFIHQAGGAVLEDAVDDVAVPSDPADVGGTPVGVFFFEIKNPFGGGIGSDGVPAGGVDETLGFAGGAGGVKDIERMLGVERL